MDALGRTGGPEPQSKEIRRSSRGRILVVDDERAVCRTCRRILEVEGYAVQTETSGLTGTQRAIEESFDLVLLDLKMPDVSGMEALDAIKEARPELPVIIITGYATIQTSIEAIKRGAFHYVPKPFTPDELSLAVDKALEDRRVRDENAALKEALASLSRGTRLIGRSPEMLALRRQIAKVAPSPFTVTIYGESGTGKELVARAIHDLSPRADKPFVAVDLAALAPGVLESELFGHVRGAFTGATRTRPGTFQMADGGTLFLDELASLPLDVQGKLLRVLETQRVRPVGGEREQDVDVRVVAATNRDLWELVEAGRLREDLYYRLNVLPLTLPPLRDRREDIPLLATHFLEEARKAGAVSVEGFQTAAMARLLAHHWPGNVRELRNVVFRLAATAEHALVGVQDLPPELRGGREDGEGLPGLDAVPQTAQELKEAKRRVREAAYARLERAFAQRALEAAGGNVSQAARAVGMARPNFHALLRRHGLRGRDLGPSKDAAPHRGPSPQGGGKVPPPTK